MSISEEYNAVSETKFYFILGALLFFAIPIPFPRPQTHTQKAYENFIINFNRTYQRNASEYQERYQIFKETLEMIENLQQDNRTVFDINQFSDVSIGEFSQRYLLVERPQNISRLKFTTPASLYRYKQNNFGHGPAALPQRVDWRTRGIITPIRNQGECGSCYAQSVIANVEAMHALKLNITTPTELSVQQMIDCSGNSNYGCKGGDTCHLLRWLKKENITILPKRDYMMMDRNYACQSGPIMSATSQSVHVRDYTCFNFVGKEYEMLAFLAFKGPLIASVDALPWKHYVGGVIKGVHCNAPSNHAIQIVGYDLGGQEELAHFIVRNSWGTGFGYRGYGKIAIGGNVCGIAEEVSSVSVD